MSNHPHVLFAGVGQLPTCKQCYYTTTEPLKPKLARSILKFHRGKTRFYNTQAVAVGDRIVG